MSGVFCVETNIRNGEGDRMDTVKRAILVVCVLALVSGLGFGESQGSDESGLRSVAPLKLESSPADEADSVELPKPRGRYSVGTETFHLVLNDLEDLTPSASDHREVIAQLFYPAREGEHSQLALYMPELPLFRRGLLVHGFPPFVGLSARMASYAKVRTSSWLHAPILRAAGPFPVILFSSGGNMSRHWYTALSQELASQGYVVAVISHAHSSMDVFPGGGFLASDIFWHPGRDVAEAEVERRDNLLARRLADDAREVLDALAGLNATFQTLRGGLDLNRVGIIGHSRGGSTVTAACQTDSRIDACVIYDNLGEVAGLEGRLSQPRLTLRTAWGEERTGKLAAILAASDSDAFDAVISGANHFSFSDLPIVDPVGYPSDEIDPVRAHEIISDLTEAFLDRYVKHQDRGFTQAVSPLPPEVSLRVF